MKELGQSLELNLCFKLKMAEKMTKYENKIREVASEQPAAIASRADLLKLAAIILGFYTSKSLKM